MKKALIVLLSMIMTMSIITGCKKTDEAVEISDIEATDEKAEEVNTDTKPEEKTEKAQEKIPVKIGAYVMEYEEEIGGENVKIQDYILFKEDGTGFSIAQDDVKITWDADKINTEGGSTYTYTVNADGTLSLEADGIVREYKYSGETLPEEVIDKMRLDLDGNEKITNMEAADEFNYIINSDTIDFYDVDGQVSYSASVSEQKDMLAAYYELTDDKNPVLLIQSPAAPHYVGYAHALQFKDGTVYNSMAEDDIREIYANSGVVVGTYTGGSYGETNYYYYGFDDEGYLDEVATKIVMEIDDYAKDYEENFGEKFEDKYYMTSANYEREEVSKEDFEKWLSEKTAGEEPITELNWKPLDKVFYFN